MTPSIKTLQQLTDRAPLLRKLLRGEVSPLDETMFPKTYTWSRQCYNAPSESHADTIMNAVSELIEGYGVEEIRQSNLWDHYWNDFRYVYVNMGDAYAGTLVYDTSKDKYFVSSWGDVAERLGNKLI